MNTEKLPWHEPHWNLLEARRVANRFPHALLIRGPTGVGKLQFAQRLSSLLLCLKPDSQPCGVCRGCTLLAGGAHPDFTMVKPENDAQTISVAQIRELISSLSFTAALDSRKVSIVAPADRMTTQAANCLLKTLEEPPGDSVLILVSAKTGQLPSTILSRCQTIDIPPVATNLGGQWLADFADDGQDSDLLMNLSQGQPLTALAWGQTDELSVRSEVFSDLTSLFEAKPEPVRVASRWQTLGLQRSTFWLGSFLMDLVRLATTRDSAYLTNRDLAKSMQPLVGQLDLKRLILMLDACNEATHAASVHAGLNEQLLLEDFAITLASAMRRPS